MGILTDRRGMRQRVRDLSVGQKLLTAFTVVGLIVGLQVACLFVTVQRLGAADRRIVEDAGATSKLADRLRFAAADLRASQQAYVLAGSSDRAAFDQVATLFEATLDEIRARASDDAQLALIHKITADYQAFLATDQLVWSALRGGEEQLARNLVIGSEQLAFGLMAGDAARIADLAEADRLNAVAEFGRTTQQAQWFGLALGLFALATMTLASVLITQLIRVPLRRVQQAAERAAFGDLSVEVEVDGRDETGRLAVAFNSMMRKLRQREESMRVEHRRQEMEAKVRSALEMADSETAALAAIGRSITAAIPERSAELLLADNSRASLEQAVVAGPDPDGPGCPVQSPAACPAVRSGSVLSFEASDALDACPHLQDRNLTGCSAVCAPVTFMGRAIGVVHAVSDAWRRPTPDEIDQLAMVAMHGGARLGLLRTMERTSIQASTDALTGLMNRRLFATRLRGLRRSGKQFCLAMADVDHFKRLNDTHGHDAGDRALRTFAEVAKSVLREGDLLARWGGEEFSFALERLTPVEAASVLDRLRLELAARLSASDVPGFTVSFGVVNDADATSIEDAVRQADDALYAAKAQGRNRVVLAQDLALDEWATHRTAVRAGASTTSAHVGILASLSEFDDPQDA